MKAKTGRNQGKSTRSRLMITNFSNRLIRPEIDSQLLRCTGLPWLYIRVAEYPLCFAAKQSYFSRHISTIRLLPSHKL